MSGRRQPGVAPPRRRTAPACVLFVLALLGTQAVRSDPAGVEAPARTMVDGPRGPVDPVERTRREEKLRALEQTAGASADAHGRLQREISGLRADQSRLQAALVVAAAAGRAAEERARAAETRLDDLVAEETATRSSLAARRDVLAEILAVLQRMSRHPPPPLLAGPAEIVSALRSAALLGAVAPALRDEARRLAADLERLGRLRVSIAADGVALEADYAVLAAERDRIAGLVSARQERLAAIETDAGRERRRGESLGAEARTLRDLVDRMEADAVRDRRRAEQERAGQDEMRQAEQRFAAAASREPARLAPRQPFAESRGALVRPASGSVLRDFGAPDGSGGAMRGVALATRPRAFVTAPADATVVFAGPFRAYGRLLILNAGGGYYLLLAGMDRIDVEVGQFVLGGEPIARMGESAAPSAALGVVEADGPVLYVELRKDGGPIDPGPWWAKSQSERARG